MEEDDEISEMIKRLKNSNVKLPKNVHLPPEEDHGVDIDEDEDEHDHNHDHAELETEISSINDTDTGEEIKFHIEGEDF